jgi:hypothetical protein
VLGLERERLGEVGVELGGALAGNPVEQVERDVVKSGITENVHRTADVVRPRAPLKHLQQPRLERLSAKRDTVDTVS